MKKRFRNIIVNGKIYSWNVQPNSDPYEGGGTLKLWKRKKVIYETGIESDQTITPSYVAELISVIEDYGDISLK